MGCIISSSNSIHIYIYIYVYEVSGLRKGQAEPEMHEGPGHHYHKLLKY